MRTAWRHLSGGTLLLFMVFTFALSAAVPSTQAASTIKILMYNGITATATNSITPHFQIVNTGTTAIALTDLKIRYYYTEDGTQAQSFWCDWSTAGSANVIGSFVSMSSPVSGADHYLEIGFGSGAGSLAAGATLEVQARFAKADWSNYDQSNDYSFRAGASSYAEWNNVVGYLAGTLAWGTAPDSSGGITPTPTTAPTSTPTALPTNTPTSTPPAGSLCANTFFCDGFESQSGTTPSGDWQVSYPNCQGSGTATVDRMVAHSGTTSIRVDGHNGYCNHVFFGTQSAFTGSDLYVRFFVRHTTALPTGHVTFVAMRDTNDNSKDLRMGGQNGALQWNRESDDATLPVQSPAGVALSVPLPTNQWSCVQFEVNESQGNMRTWLDGSEVAGLHLDNVATQDVDAQWLSRQNWRPALVDLRLGWESYAGDDDTLWFDDVATGSQQLSCGA
jgi:polysaccharide lyase-like protein/cellulose binding protein with CBM3 domain